MKQKYFADLPWQPELFNQTIFKHLAHCFQLERFAQIPDSQTLTNGLFEQNEQNLALAQYEFVRQTDDFEWNGLSYEALINQHKKIPTRVDNWHDFFNACIWHLFPQTKQTLNQLHTLDINQHGAKKRTKQRDAITLFDECGIVVAYQNESQKEALQNHEWRASFWQQRDKWFKNISPFIFGHAMYEMSLKPFIGLTAKAYFIKVEADFFTQSLTKQYAHLDSLLAADIVTKQTLSDNRFLSPLPLLGIPGWYSENEAESFYLNTDYFRPKRQKTA